METKRSDEQKFNVRINLLILESLISVRREKNEGSYRPFDKTVSAKTRSTQYNKIRISNQELKKLFETATNSLDYCDGTKRFKIPEIEAEVEKENNNFKKLFERTHQGASDVILLSEHDSFAYKISTYIKENVTKNNENYEVKIAEGKMHYDEKLYDFMYYVLNKSTASEVIINKIINYQGMVNLYKINECSEKKILDYIKSLDRQLIIANMAKLIKEDKKGINI